MRTREMRVPALLLPLVFMGLTTPGLSAQNSAAAAIQAARSAVQDRVVTGDRTVEVGEVVDDIVVLGGDLRVRGEISGDAVVIGGNLILEESGMVDGDALVTGGELINEGGRVRGEMRAIEGGNLDIAREIERALSGAGIAEATRGTVDVEREVVRSERRERRQSAWYDPIRRGFAGLISTLALGLVLAGIGSVLVFYGRPYLEIVSDTIRSSGVRSAATGLAASFLAVPAFVVLIVALAVSIVGIPFLLIAIPAYPLALFAGAVFGLLALAHAVGERTAEQTREGLDFRYRNSYAYLFTGLGMLLTPLLAAHLIGMTGFLGFIGTLLRVVTWMAIWVAATVGFGAVILSRAGTRRTFVAPPPESVLDDDLFGDEPTGRSSHA
ncbi:MAG: polymer-forming cytoskeletal protein [Gemmatimonadota bacterium]